MRNTLIFSIIVLMLLAFAGCGSRRPEQADQDIKSAAMEAMKSDRSISTAGAALPEPVQAAPSAGIKKGSLSVASDKSAELPKNYPSDKFPVYEGSFIYSAIETDGSYILTAYSRDEIEKVIGFYEKFLEGAKPTWKQNPMKVLPQWGQKQICLYFGYRQKH